MTAIRMPHRAPPARSTAATDPRHTTSRSALGGIAAQGSQAAAGFVIQVLVARLLGLEDLGVFAILYGVIILASALVSGLVGDSLVVLDRFDRGIRSALQQYAVGLSTVGGLAAAGAVWLVGLLDLRDAILFAAAIVAFCLEETLRRLLMAQPAFWRVAAVDLAGFAATLAALGLASLLGEVDLGSFLGAIAVGQTFAAVVAVAMLPRRDRQIAAFSTSGYRVVAGYGIWRSLQQLLRPAMLTVLRSIVTLYLGLAATGLLEAARIYAAPTLLIVSGLSSFLFVSFARDRHRPVSQLLRSADRAMLALIGGAGLIGGVAVAALPLLGPLLFGTSPDALAVVGWIAYSASVAAVTPYGALAAVAGKQSRVFAIRVVDTALSILAALAVVAAGASAALIAVCIAGISILGGVAIRMFVLVPLARSDDRRQR